MRKVCVIGHFGFGKELLNGQTIKTKIITEELQQQFGEKEVGMIDTHSGKKYICKLMMQIGKTMKYFSNVVIMPAHNGIKFLAPTLCFWKRIYRRKIHYIVIGGWLPEFLKERKCLQNCLKKFDGIYVETNSMKKALENQGFCNIFVMPNCKDLKILSENELVYSYEEPYKLCTFSRVMKEKGIEDIIHAVSEINQKNGRTVFSLDIYGQIDSQQKSWFQDLSEKFPDYIKYGGFISFDKSTEILKNYFALVFPTYYDGEGFAGSLIDAMAAGIPVIASDWRYNPEIVKEGENGCLFRTRDVKAIVRCLENMKRSLALWNKRKKEILKEAYTYLPCNTIEILINQMD